MRRALGSSRPSLTSRFSRRRLRLEWGVPSSPRSAAPRARRPASASRFRWWLVVVPLGLLILVVLGIFGVRWWVDSYLRSEGFRRTVDQQASHALHADGKFGLFQWQGTEVYSDQFDAVGHADSPLARLTAEQVRARFDLGAIWRHTWRVEAVDVQRIGVVLARQHPTPEQAPPVTEAEDSSAVQHPPPSPGFLASLMPNRVELGQVKVEDFSLAWNADQPDTSGKVAGVRLTAHPLDDGFRSWQIDGAEGQLEQAHFPTIRLDGFAVRSTPHEVFLTRADGEMEGGGKVDLSGKQGLDGERLLDLQADFDAVPVGPFLPQDWRARLKGTAGGNVHVTGGGERRQASGHVEMHDGKLTALPMLDELATFTMSERYRQAPLQKAQADFDWQDGNLDVKNLVVESEGLLRLEGGFVVRNARMDGTIQVGVARSALRWMAVVGTQVFNQPERDGYVWTTVKLSGPVDQPSEDLTPRLVAAIQDAALKKAQQGANGVLDTAKSLLDLLH